MTRSGLGDNTYLPPGGGWGGDERGEGAVRGGGAGGGRGEGKKGREGLGRHCSDLGDNTYLPPGILVGRAKVESGGGGWDEAGKGAAKGGRKGVGKEAGRGRGGQVCWQGAGRRWGGTYKSWK